MGNKTCVKANYFSSLLPWHLIYIKFFHLCILYRYFSLDYMNNIVCALCPMFIDFFGWKSVFRSLPLSLSFFFLKLCMFFVFFLQKFYLLLWWKHEVILSLCLPIFSAQFVWWTENFSFNLFFKYVNSDSK